MQEIGNDVLELESLALVMQGIRNEEHNEQQEEVDVELNYEFWEELLNERIGEETGRSLHGSCNVDVDLLSEKLGYLSSTSPR